MRRREFLKLGSAAVATGAAALGGDAAANRPVTPAGTVAASGAPPAIAAVDKPNVIVIIADQRTYGLSRATGFALDTSPTLDRMQREGVGFARNYCAIPACVPSRTTMLTGRWPEAHHVRMNLQDKPGSAFFEKDMYQVAKAQGYRTGLVGKNHTYMRAPDTDVWKEYFHDGGPIYPNSPPETAALTHG